MIELCSILSLLVLIGTHANHRLCSQRAKMGRKVHKKKPFSGKQKKQQLQQKRQRKQNEEEDRLTRPHQERPKQEVGLVAITSVINHDDRTNAMAAGQALLPSWRRNGDNRRSARASSDAIPCRDARCCA